jgi:DNA-binding response OmpR family regulator
MKILLVEDDYDLNDTIKEYLENFYDIKSVYDGEEALKEAYEHNYDLILLDVKLPKIDGFEVAKEIRKTKSTPIIFLTSLDSEKDVEKGFLSGGDDYIRKPFSLKELKLRIDALYRRLYGGNEKIVFGDFEYDIQNKELFKNGEKIKLKPKVVKLLDLFLKNRNKIITKDEIFDYLYDFDETPNEMSLRTFINTLRKIFGSKKIETIKEVGYKFVG